MNKKNKHKEYKVKIFSDFDGTITKNDIWLNCLGKFITDSQKLEEITHQFRELQITSRQCIQQELDLVKNFDFKKFNEYLGKEELDDYFREFLEFCSINNFELTIVSEGLDYYLDYIFKKEKISNITYYCNKLKVESSTDVNNNIEYKLKCLFPNSDEHCRWCGTCKRNILINKTNSLDNEVSVLIGDGATDYCASHYADIVFAKKSLASYCWKNNITYFEFQNFRDIKNKLIKLIESKSIKIRQTADINRKHVFLGG